MSGVKGKSGGKRPGAGAKPKARPVAGVATDANGDSLDFLRSVIRDESVEKVLRVRAAIAVAQYEHIKTHDGGKKDAKQDAAEALAKGRFGPSAAPKLAAMGGKVING